MAENEYHYGVGRRKAAVATARLYPGQKGVSTVNGRPLEEYFNHAELVSRLLSPLNTLEQTDRYQISLKVQGGGLSGQADAARLAIAKALVAENAELRSTLKRAGFIKRDARVKERKKYGLKRARKAPQFTKR